ncbi:MAG: hypothetical protein ACREEM_33525 [Blastocatellia bacterium]
MGKKKTVTTGAQPVPSDDQDSAWKEMLDEYLPAFLRFFFPAVHEEIDWTRGYESLDKELAENRPAGSAGKLLADKLFKVWLKSGRPAWLLIHIEVQGRAGRVFDKRVFFYNFRLRDDTSGSAGWFSACTNGAYRGRKSRTCSGSWIGR